MMMPVFLISDKPIVAYGCWHVTPVFKPWEQYPVQVGRLRRPQVVVQVCVFCVRWRAHKTHKLVQKDYLRRSRNVYGGIALHAL